MDLEKLGEFFTHAMTQREQVLSAMDATVVEASSGGGAVTVQMNGRKQILKLTIAPAAAAAANSDITLLEDLIIAAVNEAALKATAALEASTSNLIGDLKGIGLPGV